jgi:pimeloyl-ACP methyl ester carboxylesterase
MSCTAEPYGGTLHLKQAQEVRATMRKTLVMIPAFGCDAGLYASVVPRLGGHVDVLTHVATEASFAAMAAGVLAAAPERFAVLGTSMGGRLALEVALAAPDRVEGLVVIGAGAGAVADQVAGLRRSSRIRGGEKQQVIVEMGNMIAHLPGPRGPATREAFINMAQAMDPETLARQSDALAQRTDKWGRLGEISCPVLCLWGVHDQFSPAADGKRIAAAVPRGDYVELPDCGHFPTLEYPDETAEALGRWLHAAVV